MKLSPLQAVVVILILCVVEIGGLVWLSNVLDDVFRGIVTLTLIHFVLGVLVGIVAGICRFYHFLTGQ